MIQKRIWSTAVTLLTISTLTSAFCPSGCECSEEEPSVKCIGVNLELVPLLLNPSLKRLNLAHNYIGRLAEHFTFYRSLEYLDLSYNRIIKLEKGSFADQSALKNLHLSYNNISTITAGAFRGLNSLRLLDLSSNGLESLPAEVFSDAQSLEILLLTQNRLYTLLPKTFRGLKNLRVLDMCANHFQSLPGLAFADLMKLERLHLCRNFLTLLKATDFPLPSLQYLSLESNLINNIQELAFYQMHALQKLDLTNNLLNGVPISALASTRSLETLSLSKNNLTILPADAFKGIKHLTSLEISGCAFLHTVSEKALENCRNLQALKLAHNPQLRHIPTNWHLSLTRLHTLDLTANGFTTLSKESLPLSTLRSLDLRDNPLFCNCSLQWLASLLISANSTVAVTDVKCMGPEQYRGVYISRLKPNQLLCLNQIQLIVGVSVVSISSLLLVVLSVALCRYRRKNPSEKFGSGWTNGTLAPWPPDDDEHTVATRHIIADEYLYHTYASIRKVPVTEV